MLSEH